MMHMAGTDWRKASHSGNGGGSCVEVGRAGTLILIRDTTDRERGSIPISPKAFREFTASLRTEA